MSQDVEAPKREPTPTTSLSSIPLKRTAEEAHSPAVPSPLNAEVNSNSQSHLHGQDDTQQAKKSARAKKDTLKKREAKGSDSTPATPDARAAKGKTSEQAASGPLRYKLAPPKLSDFEPPRGPVLTFHHEVQTAADDPVDFYETSDQ
jgi:COMPASS component BRE2